MHDPNASGPTPPTAADDLWMITARRLTHTLDKRHLDPLLGLFFPFVGDFVGGVLGAYLLVLAWRRKKSKITLARMALNTAIDTAVGAVPLAGDLFDYFFRANSRNLALLDRDDTPRSRRFMDGAILGMSLALLLLALCLPLVLLAGIIYWVATHVG